MGALGLVQGFREECDPSRRFAARNGKTAMEPPKIGQASRVEPLAPFGRRPQRLRRPPHVVLKQPGLGESTTDLNVLVPVETRLTKAADKKRCRLRAHAALEGANGLAVKISHGHGREYSRYTGEVDT